MKKEQVEDWYQKLCNDTKCTTNPSSQTPFYQKWMAFSLLMSVPVVLTGCGNETYTAEDECEWEREANGQWEIDCDNENSSWYSSKGYSSKNAPVHSTSPLLKKGVGSGGSKSGGFFSGG